MSDPYWWSPTSRFSVEDFVQKVCALRQSQRKETEKSQYAPSKVTSEDTTVSLGVATSTLILSSSWFKVTRAKRRI